MRAHRECRFGDGRVRNKLSRTTRWRSMLIALMTAETSHTEAEPLLRVCRHLVITGLALAAIVTAAPCAFAANSYDNCTGFVDTPDFIPKPGTWCLRQNLVTGITSGAAIWINADHVTIDCNGFALDNSVAGPGTGAAGVLSYGHSEITVRNCTIQGFAFGLSVIGGALAQGGHVIENNHLLRNRFGGISVEGYGSLIRGNIVVNTGGGTGANGASGISASGRVDVIDNIVDGVFGDNSLAAFQTLGIYYADAGSVNAVIGAKIEGNRVRNLTQKGSSPSEGIEVVGHGISVRDNLIGQSSAIVGDGLLCFGDVRVRDNIIKNYGQGMRGVCSDDGGNVAY